MIKVGIIGHGVVGKNTGKIFSSSPNDIRLLKYDKFKHGIWDSIEEISAVCDFIFVCLPTPMSSAGQIDLTYIENTLANMASHIGSNKPIIIIRSTAVSGSCDKYAAFFSNLNIAFVPEFLTEKNPWEDTVNATRIVIGTDSIAIFFAIKSLFEIFYKNSIQYIHMSRSEAEMYKYACNYMLSMSVLAANELYFICQAAGIDYSIIQQNLIYDKRIGSFTVVPGYDGDYGVGGKCFPKDVAALAYLAKEKGYSPEFLEKAIEFNLRIRTHHDWLEIPGAISNCKFGVEK